ncbi:hypothetical protein HI914_04509 [Erysiphe necator]|nr:hypothetical protein HI914_04509 [Erysiphe necator]
MAWGLEIFYSHGIAFKTCHAGDLRSYHGGTEQTKPKRVAKSPEDEKKKDNLLWEAGIAFLRRAWRDEDAHLSSLKAISASLLPAFKVI